MDNIYIKKNNDIPKLIKKIQNIPFVQEYIEEYSIINLSEIIKTFENVGELIILINCISSSLNVRVPLKSITNVDYPLILDKIHKSCKQLLYESIDLLNDIQIYLNSNQNEISNSNFIEKIIVKKPNQILQIYNQMLNESNRLLEFANGLFKISSDEISILMNDKNKKVYIEILKSNLHKENDQYNQLLEYESNVNKKRNDLIFKSNIDSFKIESQIKDTQNKFNQLYKEINLINLSFIDNFLSIQYNEEYDLVLNSSTLLIKLILNIKFKIKLNQLFWLNQLNKNGDDSDDNVINNTHYDNPPIEYNYLINYSLPIIESNLKNEIKKIGLNWLSIVYINYMALKNIKLIKQYYNNDLLVYSTSKETNSLKLSIRKEVCEKIEQYLFKQNQLIDIL